ncbi:MAG: Gordonia phage BritBrat [Actinomycetota bacterium]
MKFRADIQGLRAVAVLLVILHHAFPEFLPGGFFGVDIFFVISGYIITQILMRDKDEKWSRFFLEFYARRIRRILPSALLIIVATTLASYFFLGEITGADTALDGIYATLFIANIHFNNAAVDYFASSLPQPILQHYWSLSIEEQFYFLWPLIFFITARYRRLALITVLSISSISLLWALSEIATGSGTAYFSTQTRIWELGTGAALALIGRLTPNKFISNLALLTLIGAAFVIEDGGNFPGTTALIVVAATAILIWSGTDNPLISNKVMVYLGDLSYLLYLVHWPVLHIFNLYKGTPATLLESLILLIVVFVLSIALHHGFENPIRYSKRLMSKSSLTIWLGLAGITITVLSLNLIRGAL